ncbi:MAG: hypothetical protein SFV54_24545 [Bryobacteraceae bacterium]|nr:hypothetical protein [Bryobacteraceae bacterium]
MFHLNADAESVLAGKAVARLAEKQVVFELDQQGLGDRDGRGRAEAQAACGLIEQKYRGARAISS